EAVDAGNAVADGQHLSDFGDFGFLAEILDLVLEDRGDLSGADVHQRTSFMAVWMAESLVFREASTMRLPSCTMMPPMIDGSTLRSILTSLEVTAFSAAFTSFICAADRGSATVTLAVSSPRDSATTVRKARIMRSTANRRRFWATRRTKLPARPPILALSRMAEMAPSC